MAACEIEQRAVERGPARQEMEQADQCGDREEPTPTRGQRIAGKRMHLSGIFAAAPTAATKSWRESFQGSISEWLAV